MLNNSSSATGTPLGTLDFGNALAITAPINIQTMAGTNGINLKCTPGATAIIKVNDGAHPLGGTRRMKHSSANNFVSYQVYKNAARTEIWNNTTGTSHHFLNDTEIHFTIYATVPPQPAPPAGTYLDTLVVTVEF